MVFPKGGSQLAYAILHYYHSNFIFCPCNITKVIKYLLASKSIWHFPLLAIQILCNHWFISSELLSFLAHCDSLPPYSSSLFCAWPLGVSSLFSLPLTFLCMLLGDFFHLQPSSSRHQCLPNLPSQPGRESFHKPYLQAPKLPNSVVNTIFTPCPSSFWCIHYQPVCTNPTLTYYTLFSYTWWWRSIF